MPWNKARGYLRHLGPKSVIPSTKSVITFNKFVILSKDGTQEKWCAA